MLFLLTAKKKRKQILFLLQNILHNCVYIANLILLPVILSLQNNINQGSADAHHLIARCRIRPHHSTETSNPYHHCTIPA